MRDFIWKALLIGAAALGLAAILLGVWGVISPALVLKLVVTAWALMVVGIPVWVWSP